MPESITGAVIELFVSVKDGGKQNLLEVSVDEEGVSGDKFYAKGKERSVLIASSDSYTLALANSVAAPKGSLGENILMDINPYNLDTGRKIYIGDVVLEITQNCTMCNSLAKVDAKLPELLKNHRGIFAKVIKSGKIRKGDAVSF